MNNGNRTTNVVHFATSKLRIVTRSVILIELHALLPGLDFLYFINDLLRTLLGRKIEIKALVDSKTVFDVVQMKWRTTEKRLQIYIHALM